MNVGELVAYLSLDDKQYTQGLDKAQGGMSRLAGAARTGGQAIATSLTTAVGLAATMATMATSLVKTGANYNVLQQNSRAALTTILGSQTAVNEQMEKLNELTSRSPFGKDVFIEGQQQLLAFGMAAEKVVPTLDAVQNAVAATGGSSQQLSEITFVLAQIQAAGKITGQDLMQLGQRGIDAASLIGSSLGMSGQEVRDSITAGTLDSGKAIDALVAGMTAKFGGATDLIKQQWTGAVDRIHAAWRDTGAIIAAPFIDPNGGGQAVTWANLVADSMRSVQKHVTTAMDAVDAKAGPTFDRITSGLEKANTVISGFDMNGLIRQVESLSRYTPLISGATTALVTLGLKPIPYVGQLASGIGPLVAGVTALVLASPELREVGGAFTDALAPAIPRLEEATQGAADLALELIDAAAPGLTRAAEGAGDFLAGLSPLAPMIVDTAGSLVPLVGAAADLVGWVAQLPAPMLAAAAAIIAFHKPLGAARDGLMSVWGMGQNAAAGVSMFIEQAGRTGVVDAFKQSVGGVGGALSGILSPAGLVGAGLTVLTGIIAIYAQQQAEAKAQVDSYVDSLNEQTGAITDTTRAGVVAALQKDDTIAKYKKMGGEASDLTEAILGNAGAQERVNRVTAEWYAKANGSVLSTLSSYTREADDVNAVVKDQSGYLQESQEAWQNSADAADTATGALQRQKDALDALSDAQKAQAAANGDLVAAQYQTKDSMADLKTTIEDMAAVGQQVALDSAGNVDLMADSNRGLVESAMDAVDGINNQMNAYANTGATQSEVTAKADELTGAFYQQLEAAGLNEDQARQLGEAIGLIPDYKATVIDMTVDDEAAKQDLDDLLAEVSKPHDGTITILADDNPAMAQLAESLGLVETSEGTYSINADDSPAIAQLLLSLGVVDTSTGTITIDGNNQPSQERIREAQRVANGTSGTMKIYGQDFASAVADAAKRHIEETDAVFHIRGVVTGVSSVRGAASALLGNANGSVLDFYANGGVRENHVAQIAPAGAYRLWAEQETGGEGYVPLARSKRARSNLVMGQIADELEGVFISDQQLRSMRGYADGEAGTAPLSTGTLPTVINYNTFTINARDLDGIRSVEQFMARFGFEARMTGLKA
jgi:tape measure domain-containing protein